MSLSSLAPPSKNPRSTPVNACPNYQLPSDKSVAIMLCCQPSHSIMIISASAVKVATTKNADNNYFVTYLEKPSQLQTDTFH